MEKNMKEKTCCFTGHRAIPARALPALAEELEQTLRRLIGEGMRYFGAGGALGFDTLAAETVLRLKGEYPGVRLILVLPCRDQTRGWKEADVRRYREILSRADKVVYTAEHYSPGCMHRRNRHLVDNSSVSPLRRRPIFLIMRGKEPPRGAARKGDSHETHQLERERPAGCVEKGFCRLLRGAGRRRVLRAGDQMPARRGGLCPRGLHVVFLQRREKGLFRHRLLEPGGAPLGELRHRRGGAQPRGPGHHAGIREFLSCERLCAQRPGGPCPHRLSHALGGRPAGPPKSRWCSAAT